jgi:hypothetical protein
MNDRHRFSRPWEEATPTSPTLFFLFKCHFFLLATVYPLLPSSFSSRFSALVLGQLPTPDSLFRSHI